MEKTAVKRTLKAVMDEINANVNTFNGATDASARNKLKVGIKTLCNEYNTIAKVNAFAKAFKSEVPVVALVKTFFQDTINVSYKVVEIPDDDGTIHMVEQGSVKEGEKPLDLFEFLAWTSSRNKLVAHDKLYIAKVGDARTKLLKSFEKAMAAPAMYQISKGFVKTTLQEAIDSIVFIPCENDKAKNAIVVDGKKASYLIALAAQGKVTSKEKSPEFNLEFLGKKNWESLLVHILHMIVENKEYTITYGDSDKAEDEAKAEEAKAEAKPEAKKEASKK